VAAAAAGRPDWECHIQADAGHAFDNHDSDMFHRPDAAARAWDLTSEFLARELPTSAAAAAGA
jgi:carboxymethylenebutenolidase